MRRYLGPVIAICWKDILLETRSKDILVTVSIFSLLVVVIFNFAVEPNPRFIELVAPGVIWIAIMFGGTLGIIKSFTREKEQGNIHALMLAPVGKDAVFFGKMLANFLFMVRISDSRISGTAFGTVVIHISPESAIKGPLAAVQTGDVIELDVPNRKLNLKISQKEIENRLSKRNSNETIHHRGYKLLYTKHVLQADRGCDFDFLSNVD